MTAPRRSIVAAAVVESPDGFLVTRRQKGVHLEGLWEFPGGKCEAGESLRDCLRRELREELGVESTIGEELAAVTHDYPELTVELHFFACAVTGNPQALLGQAMRWVPRSELASLKFPPADEELIRLLAATGYTE
ncbi:MAG: (deoxy)nucleoside triphosphate pyrophosphohydrolase [Vicinamibacterales bacterium]